MGKDKDSRHAGILPGLQPVSTAEQLRPSMRPSRLAFVDKYAVSMQHALTMRENSKMIDTVTSEDLTPPLLEDELMNTKILNLSKKMDLKSDSDQDLRRKSSEKFTIDNRLSTIDDNLAMSISDHIFLTSEVEEEAIIEEEEPKPQIVKTPPFIKIVLRKTPEILFFEQRSLTVTRGTVQAQHVDEDNKKYDFITIGKGRMRRTTTSETQTDDKLYKGRETNTPLFKANSNEAHVSNFLMFQAFKYANAFVETDPVESASPQGSAAKTSRKTQMNEIVQKNSFKRALMTTLRILAGNVFEQQQRCFRNMIMPDPIARESDFKYRLKLLLRFNPQTLERSRKSIADLAFCPGNGDIIAVAYGIYSFGSMHVPENGYCCVWNIKNPVNPERKYLFKSAVVSVQFSPYTPQLLAIGLYDGSVEIRDISTFSETPVAVSLRTKTTTCDPILSLEWVPQGYVSGVENNEIEPLLALSQDSMVTKYRIINSPHLLAFVQMQLDRVEGTPEGLKIQRNWNQTQSNRCPQGLSIKKHPSQHDIYYILTDEGCIHKCSTNYPHQHLEVLQTHFGSVNEMDFSPWSPKLFLTVGNDWCIRIWIDGILEPIITLKHEVGPVHCAAWSKTHSTVIVSNTRKSVDIWDIRRGTLRPVSSTNIDKSFCTTFKFSRCGRSIALGNERGSVLIVGLDDMPFPPRFQYDELELAIHRALYLKPNLTTELKSIGFFGYPDQNNAMRRKKSHHCTLVQ